MSIDPQTHRDRGCPKAPRAFESLIQQPTPLYWQPTVLCLRLGALMQTPSAFMHLFNFLEAKKSSLNPARRRASGGSEVKQVD